MDHYRGTLVLITNRVGVFDETVLSRIHGIFAFDQLWFQDQFSIWSASLDRLKDTMHVDAHLVHGGRYHMKSSREILNGELSSSYDFVNSGANYLLWAA